MPIPDRQKQRGEYLRKKAGAYGDRVFWSFLFFCVLIVTALCGTGGIFSLVQLITTSAARNAASYGFSFFTILLTLLGGGGCWSILCYIRTAEENIAAIPYIPPVTPNTLPAEEVLVRGSQQPEQEQRTILLRAAENNNTAAEELLRASNSFTPL